MIVACILLNILTILGLLEFAIDGLTSNEIGALGEDWLGKATGGLGDVHAPIPGGGRIPDRTLRIPRLVDIFLEAKNAARVDTRSVAQILDMLRSGRVILITRQSLARLPQALEPFARNGLLKWVKCFP